MKFCKLTSQDDYENVAELVYYTDPYLYVDLFGSLEGAKKIMPYLLEDKKSTWYKDYIYIAKENGTLAGIVTILPHSIDWNFNSIRMAYMEAGLEMTEATHAVCEYFEDAFCHIGVGAEACNICVSPEFRGRGVGKFILSKVIEIAGHRNLELTALADNHVAVHLYKSFGFIVVREYPDYGGYGKPPVMCYAMVRAGSSDDSTDANNFG